MPDRKLFENAEVTWTGMWRDIGGVLAESAGLVRRFPKKYALYAFMMFLIGKSYHFIPFQNLEGAVLYTLATVASFAYSFIMLGFLAAVVVRATNQMHGSDTGPGQELVLRMGKALPYAVAVYLVPAHFSGYLTWGMCELGRLFTGGSLGLPLFETIVFLAQLPQIFILVIFGFCVIGASLYTPVTFRQSWEMMRGKFWPIFLTYLLWWTLRSLPGTALAPFGMDYPNLLDIYFNWLSRPLRAIINVFFFISAAVWYEKLRVSGESDQPAG
ncbi:hypothetical protein [uncultured Pseudodesulfovibrio sp.]|uniref:hypothetical protein n=1 Tax=uncultured Pseudodesulfovibrio sp. TaxID=2035858 RepID=UPI0029C7D674|nr:hypothetical protein [uncultured Pseudodesulfovibrio sp.]